MVKNKIEEGVQLNIKRGYNVELKQKNQIVDGEAVNECVNLRL